MRNEPLNPFASVLSSATLRRRTFLGLAAGGLARAVWPGSSSAMSAIEDPEPHHFLLVWADGGWDPAYLADATRLELTAAGLQHNYLGVEPERWEDEGGRSTFVSAPFHRHLSPFRDRLAVLNGVLMATSFDGHLQNANYLFTGSPFGGPSFFPDLSRGAPLDYVRVEAEPSLGSIFGDVLDARQVPLSADAAEELAAQLRALPPLDGRSALRRYLDARYAENALRNSAFGGGARALAEAARESTVLRARLASLAIEGTGRDLEPLPRALGLVAEVFRNRVSTSAFLGLPAVALDTHSFVTAVQQPVLYDALTSAIAQVLAFLRDTPYDPSRSLLDVTTVMFASEFGRTMRQLGQPIDETGTDHNPLSNTLLLAGKGIRAGVYGGSDMSRRGETPSRAHRAFDPEGVKRMGRPIDLATGRPYEAGEDVGHAGEGAFRPELHLTLPSVINTLADLFGAPPVVRRDLGRNMPLAPSLPFLRA